MKCLHSAVLVAAVVVALCARASAFLAPTGAVAGGFRGQALTHAQPAEAPAAHGVLMACRANAKKEKVKRNRDNMRRFRKRGSSRKKIARGERQEVAREREAAFLAAIFQMPDNDEDTPATL